MKLCNEECNNCPIINHANSRQLTKVFNQLSDKFGKEVNEIVNNGCPNMTCCFDCKIDNFCHIENCKIMDNINEESK